MKKGFTGTFKKSDKTLEEQYKWMNENWDNRIMNAVPENLRSKIRKIGDNEKSEITVGFTGLQKENNA